MQNQKELKEVNVRSFAYAMTCIKEKWGNHQLRACLSQAIFQRKRLSWLLS